MEKGYLWHLTRSACWICDKKITFWLFYPLYENYQLFWKKSMWICLHSAFVKLDFINLHKITIIIVCFRLCETWDESVNISGFPHRFYFGFFGMESQNFAGYYSARICLIKEKEIGEKGRGKWRWRRRKGFEMLNRYRFESI